MAIVPIYRLRAATSDEEKDRRYRFSRQPTPDPNPHPGHEDEDTETKWIVEGVAFYAWSDRLYDEEASENLQPVYEFHRCVGGRHRYYYSLSERGPRGKGWEKRPYVAFWAHAEDVEDGAPAVYRYEQVGNDENFALSVDPEVKGWEREGKPVFFASERVPVQVSVRESRRNGKGRHAEYDWTFEPSTVNLAYGSILEFVPAPHSDFVFTGLDVEKGEGDFEKPDISPHRVQLRALCTSRGKDYKYSVKVRIGGSSEEIEGDPEVINQTPTDL